ncbi:hypothetical protein AWZ03_001551 [Drosophila navojoa]|uniref:H15 domain-containing protein n=1 Tax=Drosophila navojoa TaxID=7232 RepID=A0A484BVS1_DRONA|nr:uncharacterized protein LOC108652122 [Drosophila navojoa]TDG51881.1 hypothetical protein AWZ03_001551 [Drosophila navojoa]
MALIYHDATIKTSIDVVLNVLDEIGRGIPFGQLVNYFSARIGFPASACNTIVQEALECGMKKKAIIKMRSHYYLTPPRRLRHPRARDRCSDLCSNVKYRRKLKARRTTPNRAKPASG